MKPKLELIKGGKYSPNRIKRSPTKQLDKKELKVELQKLMHESQDDWEQIIIDYKKEKQVKLSFTVKPKPDGNWQKAEKQILDDVYNACHAYLNQFWDDED